MSTAGTLESLWRYPVKSMAGEELDEAQVTPRGLLGDRVYAAGYRGEGHDLREVLVCLEADSGAVVWERAFPDFLSDIIYDRYTIGAPSVDAETQSLISRPAP